MTSRRIAYAVAVLLCARRAWAAPRCPIELRGEPEVTAPIVAELATFADDGSPCVALAITCSARDGALVIALRDAFGGEAQRAFETPAGAAAFLVSWSRRPIMLVAGTDRAPAATVAAPPPVVVAPREPRVEAWRIEVALGGILTDRNATVGLHVMAKRVAPDHWRGLGARVLTAGSRDEVIDASNGWYYERPIDVGGQVFAAYGFHGAPLRHVRLHLDFEVGGSILTQDTPDNSLQLNGMGLYAGMRAGIGVNTRYVELDLAAGLDALVQLPVALDHSPFGTGTVYGYPHLDLVLRWTL